MPARRLSAVAVLLLLSLYAAVASAAVPDAPTDLRVTSKQWNAFYFAWSDNATDETGQYLYISERGAGFYRITAYAPNTTAAGLAHLTVPGTYRIYIVAFNADGESQPSNILDVYFPIPELKAALVWDPIFPTTNDAIHFYDSSRGTRYDWLWDFGDGTSSTLRNPVKQYTAPGVYVVSLTVTDFKVTSTATKPVTVAAGSGGTPPPPPPLVASVDCGGCSAIAGEPLAFRDTTSGFPDTWRWDFGDGTTSSLKDPTHTYESAGTYVVRLSAWRGAAMSSASKSVSIEKRAVSRRTLIPAVARTTGVGGTAWRSELTVSNASAGAITLRATLLPPAGASSATAELTLAPWESRRYGDVIHDLFQRESGSGALLLSTEDANAAALRFFSQTSTSTPDRGSYGQAVDPIELTGSFAPSRTIARVEANESYRSNIGFANASTEAATVRLTLVGPSNSSTELLLAPSSFTQLRLEELFPAAAGGDLAIAIEGPSDVAAYASVVDNATHDPTCVIAANRFDSGELIVPAAGRVAGGGGTFWRSDVTITNGDAIAATVTLSIFGGATSQPREVVVPPMSSTTLRDVAKELGVEEGSGALRIVTSGATSIATRTYTNVESGTMGQSIDALPLAEARQELIVPALRHDSVFRANVGFVNAADTPAALVIELRRSDGSVAATSSLQLNPMTRYQYALSDLFPPATALGEGSFMLVARSTNGTPFFAYGSVVDNTSGDPLFIRGR